MCKEATVSKLPLIGQVDEQSEEETGLQATDQNQMRPYYSMAFMSFKQETNFSETFKIRTLPLETNTQVPVLDAQEAQENLEADAIEGDSDD